MLQVRSEMSAMESQPWGGWRVGRRGGAVLLAAMFSFVAGCHKEPLAADSASKLPVMAVRAGVVSSGTHRATEEAVGTVRARIRAVVEAKVSGRIVTMAAVPGRAVKAGDVLVEVDAQEVQARLDQARAVLQQAERELARYGTLLRQEAVTQAEHDVVESRQRVAKAAVAEVETMRGYTRIVAPFDGVVSRKLADVGDLAGPGRGLLELEDPASVRFEADVPMPWMDRIKLGDRLAVTVSTAGGAMEGVLSEIEPTADPVSRTFRIRLDLPVGAGVRAGAFGRVTVPVEEVKLVSVPASAVNVRGQMELVFVVMGDRAQLRIVKTGKRLGVDLEVLSGLEAGERVVVEGGVGLLDGQPVSLR